VSLIAWLILISLYPKNSNFLMVSKTITSLKRNCLTLLASLCPAFVFSTSKKEASLFGRKIYLEGVNDSRAEQKIRGMTLQAAYCDELTLFTEDFFSMLLSRLSMPNSKLLGTTNPDSPGHWLMKKYISRKNDLNLKIWDFFLDDNEMIPKEITESMKKEYTGVFYERFILGKWVRLKALSTLGLLTINRDISSKNFRFMSSKTSTSESIMAQVKAGLRLWQLVLLEAMKPLWYLMNSPLWK
jgi:PBSX family phage terminase large subunit